MPIYWLSEEISFPPIHLANEEGILALGGDLSPRRLLLAYSMGVFPWYNEGDPIVWWSPNPRYVLFPEELKVSKSMRKVLRDKSFQISFDKQFAEVIQNCKTKKREGQYGTWITEDMQAAYIHLHELGFAHSVEVWQNEELVGGLYGIAIGKCFFGESMFAKVSNASKAGFITLVHILKNKGFKLIDCQTETSHLKSLGARGIPREDFSELLAQNASEEIAQGKWIDWLV